MLKHQAIRTYIGQAKGLVRGQLNVAEEARRSAANRAFLELERAEAVLNDGDEWTAFGLLCHAGGMINPDGKLDNRMPWLFSGENDNAEPLRAKSA
jgi:hypothetical protein